MQFSGCWPMNAKSSGITYRDAGVDIEAGDALVDRIKPLAKRTMRPEVMAGIGGFGALFSMPKGLTDPVLVSGTDGVGTKLKLAFALDVHHTVGIDLVAMSVNDILVQGAEPLFFLDYFACGHLSVDTAAAVISGVARGCEESGCALIGGETAEMPGMYEPGEYDLAGFAVGVVERAKILDARRVREGDVVLGLASSGFHSNGYSLVRAVLERSLGTIHAQSLGAIELECSDRSGRRATLGELVMEPTRLYVKPILAALKTHPESIHALAHITGGGLVGNLPRVLPEDLCAALNKGSWPLPAVMEWIQEQGQIDEHEMHRVFNCGIGMVVVVDAHAADEIAATLTAAGERVYAIGRVRARQGDEPQTVIS
ncbi:MAG: phosphoribosylformylglycinamidine cyclo-ligase [Betaproteobacteria bacterium]|nr:phosphoribosylformylglycinamidine cyclo-ligase [Betaproteobacteria bacterium]NBY14659.1 phosphoribosylformylglycinamidine cyclo-ligase [Betaproteobacteria bacterium]NDF03527.1 phosphoribosylformylglycinamidine cyclo-ligase [Betaproteobacteria bacterium]